MATFRSRNGKWQARIQRLGQVTGSIFINGTKLNSPIVHTGDMVLVKKRGKNYFQSDENECRQQEENRPMSSCIFFEGSSYFRFYP